MQARINGEIKANEVRVISEDGTDIGIFSLRDALALVASRREDLVEIEPESVPPICQAIDYGKYRFRLHQARKAREHE
jgi:translation initiation factor IF-3